MISLIIPVFNASQYLNRCVKSIQQQIYTDFEVIFIDDGSVDESFELCNSFAKNDARIVVLHQNNQGPAAARNLGMSVAKGEFICFMDADDEINDCYLQDLIDGIGNCDLIIQGLTRVFGSELINRRVGLTGAFNLKENCDAFFYKINIERFGGPYCKLFRHSIIKNTDLFFNSQIRLAEDLDFLLRYLTNCQSVMIDDKCNYLYYDTPGSASSKIYSYEDERNGSCALEKSWNGLTQKYPVKSLTGLKDRSFSYYTARLIASISTEKISIKEKISYCQKINSFFIKCYAKWYKPETVFMGFIKKMVCFRMWRCLFFILSARNALVGR